MASKKSKRRKPHERALDTLDLPTNVLEFVEGLSSRWWQGWKSHVSDSVEASKRMFDPKYTPLDFVQDTTAMWLNLPKALLGLGPCTTDNVLELEIDSRSEDSSPDSVRLLRPVNVTPTLVADLQLTTGKKTIPKENVNLWLSQGSKTTLNAQLVNIKALNAKLAPGEYAGTIDLGKGRTFPITVIRA